MVVAESKGEALDAAENVIADYDELPALPTVQSALADGAPVLHEAQGSNVANAMGTGPVEGVLDDADVVIREHIVNQRVAPVPMEPGGIVVVPGEPAGGLSIWVSSQGPHGVRDEIAMLLGIDPALDPCASRRGRRWVRREARNDRRAPAHGQGRARARPAGEMDRDPVGEHGRDVARSWPRPRRRARTEARRHDHRAARAHDRRRRRVRGHRRVPRVLHADDGRERLHRAEGRVQLAGGRDEHHARCRVSRRGAARGDPHDGTHPRHRRRRARHRPGRDPAEEFHPARGVPVLAEHRRRRDVRHRRVRQGARRRARARRLRRVARRAAGSGAIAATAC